MTVSDSALEDAIRMPVTVACPVCEVPAGSRCVDVGTRNRRMYEEPHTERFMAVMRALFEPETVRAGYTDLAEQQRVTEQLASTPVSGQPTWAASESLPALAPSGTDEPPPCDALSPHYGKACELANGHEGRHAAHLNPSQPFVWGDDDPRDRTAGREGK